jgi:hypothetical protein
MSEIVDDLMCRFLRRRCTPEKPSTRDIVKAVRIQTSVAEAETIRIREARNHLWADHLLGQRDTPPPPRDTRRA